MKMSRFVFDLKGTPVSLDLYNGYRSYMREADVDHMAEMLENTVNLHSLRDHKDYLLFKDAFEKGYKASYFIKE